jgi:transcriptional regulator
VFVHLWDSTFSEVEWRQWLSTTDRFGVLAVNNLDPLKAPVVLPTHFTLAGTQVFVHFARPNPAWPHLEAAQAAGGEVTLAITGDYAFIPGQWRAASGVPAEHGVPTSYYAAVQFTCSLSVVDDHDEKVAIVSAQMADFQPGVGHADVGDESAPFVRMMSGIRAVRLEILSVAAKFKYDDHKSLDFRQSVSAKLEERGLGLDREAAAEQRRRLAEVGDSQSRSKN